MQRGLLLHGRGLTPVSWGVETLLSNAEPTGNAHTYASVIRDGTDQFLIHLPHRDTDYIQRFIFENGIPYELDMLRDMRRRVPPGSLIVDVGANIGNHTLYMAAIAHCRVIAFEPNSELAEALSHSLSDNDLADRVEVVRHGVGATIGKAEFRGSIPHNLGAQSLQVGSGSIPVTTLDQFEFSDSIKAIKIDAEGMEKAILEGAVGLIQRHRPLLYIESADEASFREIYTTLAEIGYLLWDTFNVTPTHLFVPPEDASQEELATRATFLGAINAYRSNLYLRGLKSDLDIARKKYRQTTSRTENLASNASDATEKGLAANSTTDTNAPTLEQQKPEMDLTSVMADLASANRRYEDAIRQIARYQDKVDVLSELSPKVRELDLHRNTAQSLQNELRNLQENLSETQQQLVEKANEVDRLTSTFLMAERQLLTSRQQISNLGTRLAALQQSRTYKAGLPLREATTSWQAAVRTPVRLYSLLRGKSVDLAATGLSHTKPVPTLQAVEPIKRKPRTQLREGFSLPARLDDQTYLEALASLRLPAARSYKFACILDDFSFRCFENEACMMQLSPDSWQEELEGFKPDLLFVESAWLGKEGLWHKKVRHISTEFRSLLSWCKKQGIPTAFWNKEDPVYFEGFINVAKLFDCVFTTDFDCISRYKASLGHDRVHFLPFACQPRIHNPIERFQRRDAISFAGAYYARYPDRALNFEAFIMGLQIVRPIEIFDRNFGHDDPSYQFPDRYQSFIVGTLKPEDVDVAYSGYRYAINLNSVKQSQTMFARRIFELIACNTTVLSNYSRGVRNIFGDVVICTDDQKEVRRRFATLEASPGHIGRLNLAALRKVMTEHTMADRIATIAAKTLGKGSPDFVFPTVSVIAAAKNTKDIEQVVSSYKRQSYPGKCLLTVVSDVQCSLDFGTDIQLITEKAAREQGVPATSDWLAAFHPQDHYGPNYLYDMALANRYAEPDMIGKAEHFAWTESAPELRNPNSAYKPVERLRCRRSMVRTEKIQGKTILEVSRMIADGTWAEFRGLAIDRYNYCENGAAFAAECGAIDDISGVDTGLSMADLSSESVKIEVEKISARPVLFGHDELFDRFKGTSNDQIQFLAENEALEIISTLADGNHEYRYSRSLLEIAHFHSRNVHFDAGPGLAISFVIIYLDKHGERVGSEMIQPLTNHQLAIPEQATHARIGFRASGTGACLVKSVLADHKTMLPARILRTQKSLVITDHYPGYSDLYHNAFVHSRMRRYIDAGRSATLFKLRPDQGLQFEEFQGVDVLTGGSSALQAALDASQPQTIVVHFLNRLIWKEIRDLRDRARIVIWIHGAEVQPWQRRQFNYTNDQEIAEAKRQSTLRMEFWKDVLAEYTDNMTFVFVSEHARQTTFADWNVDPVHYRSKVIHNPIDTDLFRYRPKDAGQRTKIMSLRPFGYRTYANDLTVEAIRILSSKPYFSELEILVAGDGKLFDETVEPLRQFGNVTLSRGFFTQQEIADLHQRFGIFLVPSRMDSHGVSRDEAMASGLVPISTAVAAIPEFVDVSSGILVEPENPAALAEAIDKLYLEPDYFLALSQGAAERVRRQAGADLIIRKEIELIWPDRTPG